MPVLRSFLLGAVTGGRSMTGLAALALTTRPGALPGPLAGLGGTRGRWLTVAGALGELAGDKLPNAPSRLTPPSLGTRMATAAASAAVLAVREGSSPAVALAPAVAGAVAGSVAGARWRALAARRGWPPLAAALLEDAVVLTLAAATVRHR
ncbi:hypothetical protein [Catenuloplanes atrovinosus]|uniref:Membrane protein n=1 Tax=Catenuloplanes atrovinosus TaxID=137266 RepID=A0AAE3YNM2_9ACTN|nr:hypothetical protein [Catenuloplanes atrovinosus]MDR7275523.1 putative membrane protein [Catenuloplanes atrovinosus]